MSSKNKDNNIENNIIYCDDYRNILKDYDFTKNKFHPRITKYEKTPIIGFRLTQLANNAPPTVETYPDDTIETIVEREYRQQKIPYIIKRTLGTYYEYWKFQDLVLDN